MRADDVPSRAAATLREVPPPPGPPTVRGDDHGVFRAVDPVLGEAVMIRPTAAGLVLGRLSGSVTVPWPDVRSVTLHQVPVHTMRATAARIEIDGSAPLDLVRMHAAGSEFLATSIEGASTPLIRVERMRLLVATIVARSGLSAAEGGFFVRGPRTAPPVEIAPRPRLLPEWAPPALIALSVLGLVWVFDLTLAAALVVTVILLVHEYGHVLAMRSLGLKVRGVLFLPLLGAATVPEQAFPTRYTEARVALAGPMTGLPLALAVLFAGRFRLLPPEVVEQAFQWTLAINFLNLIPMLPLDGGRVLLTLSAALPPVVRRVVQYAPIAVGAALLMTFVRGSAGLAVGMFVVFSIVVTGLAFRRQTMHAWMDTSGLDLAAVRRTLRDITHITTGLPREDVDGGVPPAPMVCSEYIAVVIVYAVAAASLLGLVVAVKLWPHLFGLA